jgi:L-threonylcarbamoyladenylate synthase
MSERNPQLAAELLRSGKLVAFPTETVYGLGGDATNPSPCKAIYVAKGRPAGNPLILHVADTATAQRYVGDWPLAAQRLADEFWPGPLTIVLPKADCVAPQATSNRNTVAIRVPDHPLALEMLRAFGGAVAGPSANRSTRVSPTTAEHVRSELGKSVAMILDGGSCPVGIESTVLDLTTFPRPTLLRPGAITVSEIEAIIGPVVVLPHRVVAATDSAPSPGMSAVHYAPSTPAFRFTRDQYPKLIARLHGTGTIEDEFDKPPTPLGPGRTDSDQANVVLLLSKASIPSPHDVVTMPSDPNAYARLLYATLRGEDESGYGAMFVELPSDTPEWLAVRDRLLRATRPLA